jgi:hypothetical protein
MRYSFSDIADYIIKNSTMEKEIVESPFEVHARVDLFTNTVFIFVNNLPHLVIRDLRMIHSYARSDKWSIEVFSGDSHMTRADYSSFEKWSKILAAFNCAL